MSDNWVVGNLQNALDTWNAKVTELWNLVLTSPQNFKGGGHVRAAGCTMYGEGEKCLQKLIGAARIQLEEQGLC